MREEHSREASSSRRLAIAAPGSTEDRTPFAFGNFPAIKVKYAGLAAHRAIPRRKWPDRQLKRAEYMQPILIGGRVIYHPARDFHPSVGKKGRRPVPNDQTAIDAVFSQ